MSLFVSALALCGITALIAGVILTVASIVMAVPVDETEVKVRAVLPGANCGACGFSGCDGYAAACAADPENIKVNLCIPGASAVAEAIAEILGKNAEASDPIVARVHCRGEEGVAKANSDYRGFQSCAAACEFEGGSKVCKQGCQGLGDCVKACAFDAIHVINGVAVVDRSKCVGCGACANACPKGLIDLAPAKSLVFVGCSNCDKGAATMKACSIGCIACKKCENTCKFDAVHVVDNHAIIDPEKCKNCGMCVKACPKKIIMQIPRKFGQAPVAPKPEAKPAEPAAETAA